MHLKCIMDLCILYIYMPRYFSDIVFMKHNNYTSLFYLHKNALENGHAHAFSGFNQNKKCIPVNLFNELHMRAIMPKDILKMKGISTVGRIYWRHYTRICITYPQRSRNIIKCGKECIFSCEFNSRNTSSKCSECQKYQTTSEKLSRAISFHLFFFKLNSLMYFHSINVSNKQVLVGVIHLYCV